MAMPVGGQKGVTFSWTDASERPRLCTRTPLSRKKRGGFCRPPRQLYPQEERGIQRPKYRAFCQCVATCVTPQPARVNGKTYRHCFLAIRSAVLRFPLASRLQLTTRTLRPAMVLHAEDLTIHTMNRAYQELLGTHDVISLPDKGFRWQRPGRVHQSFEPRSAECGIN